VGGGPQEQSLRAAVRSGGLEDKVVFTGRVPHSEVQRYYSVVDIFAYPRYSMRLTETVTPLKPLEAMAQGQLLVASDVGGHRELIRDGQTGMLFRAGDVQALAAAILRMLDESERWPQLRAQGRRFVEEERSWSRSVARYAPVFERLVGRAADGVPRAAHT
jgi:glycosyltransferase involved in cell wall biosynthesis